MRGGLMKYITILIINLQGVYSQTTLRSDKDVLDELLSRSIYDKRERPGATEVEEQTTVNVSAVILSLSSPHESSQSYEIEFLLHQKWVDKRLSYSTRHKVLNALDHIGHIWLPDTYFIKQGGFKHPKLGDGVKLKVEPNGAITYTSRRTLVLSCQGDINIFPFDNLKCYFEIESMAYDHTELVYKWDKTPLEMSSNVYMFNAYLVDNSTQECQQRLEWRGNYSCLTIDLTFTRDKAFYFSTLFIPGLLLVTFSFITFWLEWDAVTGRIMLGVIPMLSFFTTSNTFRSNLPIVSNLNAINTWDGVCMSFIYASLLEFITVNFVAKKAIRRLENREMTAKECLTSGLINSPALINEALETSRRLDILSRVVFPFAYGVFVVYFFRKYRAVS